jgi:hypothetical protein
LLAGLVIGIVLTLAWQAKASVVLATPNERPLTVNPLEAKVVRLERRNHRLLRKLAQRERQLYGLHRQLRRRFQPSVMHAISLASAIWHVPQGELVAVGSCESHLYPYATNGQYRGVFQEGPMFEQGPFGQAGFSVFDPYANVFTAALTVSRQGWRQWECASIRGIR